MNKFIKSLLKWVIPVAWSYYPEFFYPVVDLAVYACRIFIRIVFQFFAITKMLRKSFWDTVHDPEYIADSKKAGFTDDEPLPGDKVQRTVKKILDIPEEAKVRLKKLLGPT